MVRTPVLTAEFIVFRIFTGLGRLDCPVMVFCGLLSSAGGIISKEKAIEDEDYIQNHIEEECKQMIRELGLENYRLPEEYKPRAINFDVIHLKQDD